MEILHARSICETSQDPQEIVGQSVTIRCRSVVCNKCGKAGTVATPGNEEVIRAEWAIRNGYRVWKAADGWQVELL